MKVSWPTIKAFMDSRAISAQFVEFSTHFWIKVFDGRFELETDLDKNPSDTAELDDWNTNYKPAANGALEKKDSDGALLLRQKVTKSGWRYDPRSLDWVTAKLNSLYNRKPTGYSVQTQTDIGDAALSFYKADGTALTQGALSDMAFQAILSADCTATAVNWQPTYDMDVIGATITVKGTPSSDIYFWALVAPDIPEAYGGRATFGNGGFNLSHLNLNDKIEINGRGAKTILYDPVNYTNKFQFLCVHEPGTQLGLQIFMEHFHG